MNAGLKAWQRVQKAAKAVEEGKTGAKTTLAAATKAYKAHVKKTATAEATKKIKAADVRAAKIGKVKPGKKAAPKRKATTTKKRTTAKRRTAAKKR